MIQRARSAQDCVSAYSRPSKHMTSAARTASLKRLQSLGAEMESTKRLLQFPQSAPLRETAALQDRWRSHVNFLLTVKRCVEKSTVSIYSCQVPPIHSCIQHNHSASYYVYIYSEHSKTCVLLEISATHNPNFLCAFTFDSEHVLSWDDLV